VPPRRAETGYGYIQVGAPRTGRSGGRGGYAIGSFVEKPDEALAELYLRSGDYWWNSGIFVTRASTWLKAIRALAPEIHAACETAWEAGISEGPFFRVDAEAFDACPSDSIDYAVMERLSDAHGLGIEGIVVPLAAGWSDVGSWDAIWEIMPKDDHGNVARGPIVFEGTQDSLVRSEGRLVACVGLKDVVVIETADAVLVANKHDVQRVKDVVARLKSTQQPQVRDHRKVRRPWGHYDSIDLGERFQVKRIVVEPGRQLSLQMHYHRAEHWIVVRGTAKVTRGEHTFLLSENESTFIAVGEIHRLENPGKIPLEIVEVQSGDYLGEDDIVRFDDQYGRADAGSGVTDTSRLAEAPRALTARAIRARQLRYPGSMRSTIRCSASNASCPAPCFGSKFSESRTHASSTVGAIGSASPIACVATCTSHARLSSHISENVSASVRPIATGPWFLSSSTGRPPALATMRRPSSRCTVIPSKSWYAILPYSCAA
jgi:mannose-1-phosphate guanylyltransferase/mannose-6-phosphate isomerase